MHGRWSVKSSLQCAKRNNVEVDATDYRTFSARLLVDCAPERYTHKSWTCTPDKYVRACVCVCVCANVKKNWDKLKERLDDASDETTFNEFQKQSCHDSQGEVAKSKNQDSIKKLVPVNHQVSLSYITSLISAIMANIINHRNIRRIYRNTKKLFLHLLPCLYENRFSGNLTTEIKLLFTRE